MGFFATFWQWLNGELTAYIGTNTAIVAAALEPAIVTLATVYVMVWGYLELTGRIDAVEPGNASDRFRHDNQCGDEHLRQFGDTNTNVIRYDRRAG